MSATGLVQMDWRLNFLGTLTAFEVVSWPANMIVLQRRSGGLLERKATKADLPNLSDNLFFF